MAIPKLICSYCGYKDKHEKYKRGSTKVEIILWLCLILPGLVYSIWRLVTKINVCPNCRTATMISTKTPHGQSLMGA